MPFRIAHTLAFRTFQPQLVQSGDEGFIEVGETGTFPVRFPGRLNRGARATYMHRFRADVPEPEPSLPVGDGPQQPRPAPRPRRGGFVSQQEQIPLTLTLFTPDGREFTANEITRTDLDRFRDGRGAPSGPWSFRVTGRGRTHVIDEDTRFVERLGSTRITLTETVPSESAPPLVDSAALGPRRQVFPFDLYRVGTFVAEIRQAGPWRGTMRLLDPDGAEIARTTRNPLNTRITLPMLNRSRDADGLARQWTLEATPEPTMTGQAHVHATVIGTGRIGLAAIRSRLNALVGPRGAFIDLFGEDTGGFALIRMRITDVVAAETIDMHGLLENVLAKVPQDGGARPDDVQANRVDTLARKSEDRAFGTKLRVGEIKVETIDVDIGPGVKLGPSVPAVKIAIATSGKGKIKLGALTVGDIGVPGNRIEIEIGITLAPDGTPQVVTAVPDTILDGDVSTAAAALIASTLPPPFGLLGAPAIEEKVEGDVDDEVNKPTVAGIREAFADPALPSRMLMTIFGAHLTYTNIRMDGDAVAFDHVAPVEPEPKPRARYRGAIGRSFQQLGPTAVRFAPPDLGDTWEAGNLAKINHVAVVMMENRSYDHVLGHRAGPTFSDGADGLTAELVAAIEAAPGGPFDVRNLRDAAFGANVVGRKTRIPIDVGHGAADVAQQLKFTAEGPGGRTINSPRGFIENFRPRLRLKPGQLPHHMVESDVLGFYDEGHLPFFGYLAEHYAYSDRYYCSHPGPTLPNRMFSLTGDVQYDRNGFPILENNDSDNFLLSRAPTIFDLMLRRGLGFRVYESQPSVTMLRMFARYATDTTNIVPLETLAADVANDRLPALSWIEPQLHAHPQDDDHPPADMHRGQIFLSEVYKVLTANPAVWEKTLLIITYDEHGGLYDHRVPPIADLIMPPPEHTNIPTGPGPIFTPSRAVSRGLPTGIASQQPQVSRTASAIPSLPLAIRYGVRVPAFVVSPLTARGKGPAVTLDHCSILKTVLARFMGTERPFLSDRVNASHSFDAFLSEAAPRLDVPAFDDALLPPLPLDVRSAPSRTTRIVTQPLSRRRMREGPVDWHELTGRWARQLGR